MSEVKCYPCYGFEETHEITKCGRLFRKEFTHPYSKNKEKIITRKRRELFGFDRNGYVYQQMPRNNSNKIKNNIFIHRLVALTFIENLEPERKTQVNHINGIKNDNRVENLEWVTPSENTQHAYDTGLNVPKKSTTDLIEKIIVEKFTNGLKKEFVAKELNLGTTVVSRVLNKNLGSEKYNEISRKISSWERFIFPIESGITKMQYGKSKFRLKRKEKYLGWFDTIEEAISFKKQYIQNNTWESG